MQTNTPSKPKDYSKFTSVLSSNLAKNRPSSTRNNNDLEETKSPKKRADSAMSKKGMS